LALKMTGKLAEPTTPKKLSEEVAEDEDDPLTLLTWMAMKVSSLIPQRSNRQLKVRMRLLSRDVISPNELNFVRIT